MMKECKERSVSRGVTEMVHGIVLDQVWKCIDMIEEKDAIPDDCISSIHMRADEMNGDLIHLFFPKQEMIFLVKTQMGCDCDLSVWHMDNEQVMMLQTESQNMIGEA